MAENRHASAFGAREAPTVRERPAASRPSVVDPMILVVDDDAHARTIYRASLEHFGYSTIERRDGIEAITAVRDHRPDVALMDVAMPRLDGLEAARRLKTDQATKGCFVIVMTAFGLDRFTDATLAGCNAFLSKPFNPFVLVDILAGLHLRERDEIVKRCGCGRSMTRSQWRRLPIVGRMYLAELRNCSCGSSLVLARCDLSGPCANM